MSSLSLDNYYTTFEDEDFLGVFWNTGVVVFTAATVTAVICTVAAWIVVRFPGRLSSVLNLATFTPIAVPSVIIGLALILVYLSIPIGLYGTIWIIAIAHITRYLSYGSRTMIASQVQIHKELEEASYTCGASFRTTLRKVIMPILLPALVSLWLWVALHSIRELSAAVLLASSENTVISTLIWDPVPRGRGGRGLRPLGDPDRGVVRHRVRRKTPAELARPSALSSPRKPDPLSPAAGAGNTTTRMPMNITLAIEERAPFAEGADFGPRRSL